MGTPSFSIVAEELLRLGARQLIRVGTCGGIAPGMRTGDLVIAISACPVDGATRTYLHGDPFAPTADFALTHALYHAAQEAGIPVHVGPVASVDVFYNPDPDYATKWRDRGRAGLRDGGLGTLLACRAGGGPGRLHADRQRRAVGGRHLRGDATCPPEDLNAAVDKMIEVTLIAAPTVDRLRHRATGASHDRDHQPRRRQPGRRRHQPQRGRRGAGLPAAEGHRPRRVLGRQRQAGGALLPRAVGLHPRRLRGPGDGRPRPGQLRDGPERHPLRVHRSPLAGRRDRGARPPARRRGA